MCDLFNSAKKLNEKFNEKQNWHILDKVERNFHYGLIRAPNDVRTHPLELTSSHFTLVTHLDFFIVFWNIVLGPMTNQEMFFQVALNKQYLHPKKTIAVGSTPNLTLICEW